jgi:hypothetical protein
MTASARCRRSDPPSTLRYPQERIGILNVATVTATPGTYRVW